MTRRVSDITIELENRDTGKVFRITEMSSEAAEMWALRAGQELIRAGSDLGEAKIENMESLVRRGILAFAGLDFFTIKPLLDEMFKCVEIVTSSGVVRKLHRDDIEEVATRIKLRIDIWELHTGFSLADVRSKFMTLMSMDMTQSA